jgi:pimeloyl-ACP methyl ester carboxylesterase
MSDAAPAGTTFCLIHGAWHDGSCWEPLAGKLRGKGHRVLTPDLPLHDLRATYEDRIGPALDALASVDPSHCVVVGHSQGSAYAALVAERTQNPLLVYLCPRMGPFPFPPGAPAAFRQGVPFPSDRADGTSVWDREQAVKALYGRLPFETACEMANRLRPLAPPPDAYPLVGHPDLPTTLLYATHDEIFEPEWERYMAREVLGVEPVELDTGHFPMVEDPDSLAGLLHDLALAHKPDPEALGLEE